MKHRSWFWHGRYEGAHGGNIPPDGPLARLFYWLGNLVGRTIGAPK